MPSTHDLNTSLMYISDIAWKWQDKTIERSCRIEASQRHHELHWRQRDGQLACCSLSDLIWFRQGRSAINAAFVVRGLGYWIGTKGTDFHNSSPQLVLPFRSFSPLKWRSQQSKVGSLVSCHLCMLCGPWKTLWAADLYPDFEHPSRARPSHWILLLKHHARWSSKLYRCDIHMYCCSKHAQMELTRKSFAYARPNGDFRNSNVQDSQSELECQKIARIVHVALRGVAIQNMPKVCFLERLRMPTKAVV